MSRRIGASAVLLGLFLALSGLTPGSGAEACACTFSESKPWSGPPAGEPSLDTCDRASGLPACVRVWGDPLEPGVAACASIPLPAWTACTWTTPQQDGEPGGMLDDGVADNGDITEIGVCVDLSPFGTGQPDDNQEPYACVNEYGDPSRCTPEANCYPDRGPCTNGVPPGDPRCVPNTYDPEGCLFWVAGLDCIRWDD